MECPICHKNTIITMGFEICYKCNLVFRMKEKELQVLNHEGIFEKYFHSEPIKEVNDGLSFNKD